MNPAQALNDFGQSLWLDGISRDMLEGGRLKRYVAELAVTGLTSNPTIFDRAFRDGGSDERGIGHGLADGRSGEALFLDLAIEDLGRAADLLQDGGAKAFVKSWNDLLSGIDQGASRIARAG